MFKKKSDGIPHYGQIIFQENRVSFKAQSESERDRQRVALLMAKNFAELVENFDTFFFNFILIIMIVFVYSGLAIT